MSAIFGIFSKDESLVSLANLQAVQNALVSCGRYDQRGAWSRAGLAFGKLLAHNTPESFYEQGPWVDPQSGWVITADARLDNRDELCSALGVEHDRRAAMPDDQLILRAALKWGPAACAQHLLGAFAFGIYDPNPQVVTLVRDPIGLRPLVYYDSPHLFAFASDVRGLLALHDIPSQLDQRALLARDLKDYAYLIEHSIYQGLLKLPPGSSLTVKAETKIQVRRYWKMEARPIIRYKHVEQYAEQLRELLDQAVLARLRTAFPIGTHFTSGLDSTALAVIAARQLKQSGGQLAGGYLWTAPVLPGEQDYETQDKQRALGMLESENIPVVLVENRAETIYHMMRDDDPLNCPLPIRAGNLAALQQADQQGIRSMLSGFGGNELVSFFGFGYLASLFVRLRWPKLLSEARQMSQNYQRPLRANLRREILPAITPEFYKRWRNSGDTPNLLSLLASYNMSLDDITPGERQVLNQLYSRIRTYPDLRKSQLHFISWGFLNYRLENWDMYGAAYAIEHRYPLLDRRLVEFALALPDEMYFQRGWRRYLFRQAMQGILPEEICWRIKKPGPQRNYILDEVVRQGERRYFQEHNGWSFPEGRNFQLDYRINRILAGLLGPDGKEINLE